MGQGLREIGALARIFRPARVLTLLLIVLAVVGGLLLIGFIGYVVAACRRYQQATALEAAQHHWPVVPEDPPRAVNADPVTLRQAITELHAQLQAARGGLPRSRCFAASASALARPDSRAGRRHHHRTASPPPS
jgi:uncharacterized membrane protein YraQ (UPF0718 family)